MANSLGRRVWHVDIFSGRDVKTVFVHLLFWAGIWFFYQYFFGYNSDSPRYVFWFSAGLLPVTAFVTYLMIYRLIPHFLLRRKYRQFALYTFYVLVASSYWIVLLIYASLIFLLKSDPTIMPPMAKNFSSVLLLVYLVAGVVSTIYLLNHSFSTISRNKELQNKILTTQLQLKEQELNYLKMQIHPHFLFNTLNTIYGFALKQSKETPDIILKLSNLLDYILYQVNKPRVLLSEELQHVKEYIDLERIRFRDSLKVEYLMDEIPPDLMIAPMLIIPLVENAFKHGSLLDGFLRVRVDVGVRDQQLLFCIRNTAFADRSKKKEGGIGLENVRKRLDLHYEGAYQLETVYEEPWFEARITVQLVNKAAHEV